MLCFLFFFFTTMGQKIKDSKRQKPVKGIHKSLFYLLNTTPNQHLILWALKCLSPLPKDKTLCSNNPRHKIAHCSLMSGFPGTPGWQTPPVVDFSVEPLTDLFKTNKKLLSWVRKTVTLSLDRVKKRKILRNLSNILQLPPQCQVIFYFSNPDSRVWTEDLFFSWPLNIVILNFFWHHYKSS